MTKMVKISKREIGATEVNAVNSREIYEYLGVKEQYADWIKRVISKYDFVENEDYVCFQKNLKAGNNISPVKNDERDLLVIP